MRHARVLVVTAVLLAGPAGAGAEQLKLGVESEVLWTDNVFGTVENTVDDTSGRIAPWAEVSNRDGRFTWGLKYKPAYEYYLDQSGLRGWDHDVNGNVQYQFTRATKLRITERFARRNSISRFNDLSDPGGEINVVGFRQRFKLNRAQATLSHKLSARDNVDLSVAYNLFEFSNENNADRDNVRAALFYSHQLSGRTSLGSSLSWTQQTFQRSAFEDRSTDFYNLAGTVSHQFDSSLRFDLSAGPAYIRSESQSTTRQDLDPDTPGIQIRTSSWPLFRQGNGSYRRVDADTCPENKFGERFLTLECEAIPPDLPSGLAQALLQTSRVVNLEGELTAPSDSRLTYFASAALVKKWESLTGRLSYTRSFSDSTAAAAVADIVVGQLIWNPERRWRVELSTSWERQEQATDNAAQTVIVANAAPLDSAQVQAIRIQEVDSGASIDYFRVFFRLSYQLARRSSLYLLASWREQSLDGDFVERSDADRFVAGIGLNYDFDPIPF